MSGCAAEDGQRNVNIVYTSRVRFYFCRGLSACEQRFCYMTEIFNDNSVEETEAYAYGIFLFQAAEWSLFKIFFF